MEINSNSMVSYNASNDSVSFGATGINTLTDMGFGSWYYQDWSPYYHEHWNSYPIYYPIYQTVEDKMSKAFKVAKLLLKKKLLVSRKLGDFIGLVESIAGEL